MESGIDMMLLVMHVVHLLKKRGEQGIYSLLEGDTTGTTELELLEDDAGATMAEELEEDEDWAGGTTEEDEEEDDGTVPRSVLAKVYPIWNEERTNNRTCAC